jgi:hypothetical protein
MDIQSIITYVVIGALVIIALVIWNGRNRNGKH